LLAPSKERLGIKAPRRIFFVKDLPRNAAGKVLRRKLAQRLRTE
jgi:acyl-coenzyme A synthetase/AMP-(fatty) acid ligase